jgi:hypothetical protein
MSCIDADRKNNRKLFTDRCVLILRTNLYVWSYFVSNVSSDIYGKNKEILQFSDVSYFIFQIREKT